jgi:dTDP-4-dehydrorhamnose 3,5-epimerase
MNVFRPEPLPELVVIEPAVHSDDRGFLFESWHRDRYRAAGIPGTFVQDVHSFSRAGVLRGLHFQHPDAQGKLVRVTRGTVFDVATDVRRGSPTFGRWWGVELSETNRRQLWIPIGFAHGFVALEEAEVEYRCTAFYTPEHARSIAWNDPEIGVEWPVVDPLVSATDERAPSLAELEHHNLLPEHRG